MTKIVIDLWMDGYETEEEMKAGMAEYVEEMLDGTAMSVKVVGFVSKEMESAPRMAALLKKIEWLPADIDYCPVCYAPEWRGHHADCELGAILKELDV